LRPVAERKTDFEDVCLPYTDAQARWEAARCLGCHDAPCNAGCEAGVDVRRFIQLLQVGEAKGAAEVIRGTNVFAGACARVCDAGPTCQLSCTREQIDAPIDIPGLEWYAIEAERKAGARPLPVGDDRGRSVAVVGGGPAGLAAAAELRRLGHRVTLFEAGTKVGGLLVAGIPSFRLPRSLVEAEIAAVLATGLELRLESPVDAIDDLLRSFDAVILATGVGQALRLGVDGEDLAGVFSASALLGGQVAELGALPMVVGGGTAAMDAATTAMRIAGAGGRVTVLYRRAVQQMTAAEHSLELARDEGMILRPLTVVERILGDREGHVAAVRCRAVDLGPEDGTGRPGPVVLSGGTFDLRATSVIVAAGEAPDPAQLERFKLTEAEPRGDENGRTGVEKLYVAGDVVGGRRSVCWAVASAVRAARAVEFDLQSGTERHRPYPVLGPAVDLSVEFLGKRLRSPFLLAAAPSTDDLEMARAGLRAGWAGLVIRTAHADEAAAAPKYPEMAPVADGTRQLVALGNIAVASRHAAGETEAMIAALKAEFPDRLIAASIVGETKTQWQKLARQLTGAGADAIECNLKAPQGTLGPRPEAMISQDPALVRIVTKWVKEVAGDVPVIVKLTTQVDDVAEIARAVSEAGGDAICVPGSVPGLPLVDVETAMPQPSVGGKACFSGITGPAVLPLSLRSIAEVARATALPVTGSGGAETWRDAAAMLLCGATTVQLCTAVMHHGFDVVGALEAGLALYLERRGVGSVAALVGSASARLTTFAELVQPGPVRARIDKATCIRCGRCHIACRDGAYRAIGWSAETREPGVLLERCVGCGLCSGVCPTDSIDYLTLGK
jgi:NADPH-dependent glutamate synthase beta subunit-like oxidoreductase/dihydroorotate dehydrogenase/Pyruvate/2-oxoacid:ferredoxin oxidoreductase delta subunit